MVQPHAKKAFHIPADFRKIAANFKPRIKHINGLPQRLKGALSDEFTLFFDDFFQQSCHFS
jgi:hypothetical protein